MDSPVQSRRSRRIAPVDGGNNEEICPTELHNLEEERNRSRKLVENELFDIGSPGKKLSLSHLDKGATEHFQSCLQLAAENKINMKNAFSFKLIDLLYSKFSKKKTIDDFTEVSSSLDAGVKIYSCRVDNVHADTLKMATTVSSIRPKAEPSSENELDVDQKDMKKKKLRKSVKSTLATNLDQINRSDTEKKEFTTSAFSTDDLIISRAIFDGRRACWHLNLKSNFWQSGKDSLPAKPNFIKLDIPVLPDDMPISKHFHNFRFGSNNESSVDEIKHAIDSTVFDFDSSMQNDTNDDIGSVDGKHDDVEFSVPSRDVMESRSDVDRLTKIMSSSDFASDISQLIISERSDYRYFNIHSLKKNWLHYVKHWDPIVTKKSEERKSRPEKNDPIDFDSFSDIKEIFNTSFKFNKSPTNVVAAEKLLITPITRFNLEEFFRLKVWREMFIIPSSTNNEDVPSDLEDMINDYDYNNPNDSQCFIADNHEGDFIDDNLTISACDVHESIDRNMFMGDNLIDVPNKVSKFELPFMVKDKSVNMKELKGKLWTRIEVLEDKKVKGSSTENSIPFSNLCGALISRDKKKDDKSLSVPIIFNAILQLANDKNLLFINDVKNSLADFVVTISD